MSPQVVSDPAVVLPERGRRRRERRRAAAIARIGALRSALVAIAAGLGVVVALAWLAPLAGFQLTALMTGSMAPGLPAGSVLLVRGTPAEQVVVGDIVSITRSDGVPVTHRVIAVEPAGAATSLTLQGDANPVRDADPVLATEVGLVLAGVPFGGEALLALREPAVGVALSILVALLVLWTWWPAREPDAGER